MPEKPNWPPSQFFGIKIKSRLPQPIDGQLFKAMTKLKYTQDTPLKVLPLIHRLMPILILQTTLALFTQAGGTEIIAWCLVSLNRLQGLINFFLSAGC